MEIKDLRIPVIPPYMPPAKLDYPISLKENLLRAFDHKKPLWMPILSDATQWAFPAGFQDVPFAPDELNARDAYDWFGSFYKYEAAQCGCTPMAGVFDEVSEWREKVKWPDLDKIDWAKGYDKLVRDPGRAFSMRLGNGIFERLHIFEEFDQCLCDMITDPEECKAFFDRMGEYKIECAKRLHEVWNFDYLTHNDDWAMATAPFFSLDTFNKTLLDSAVALADAIHAMGCRYMLHCCGKMDDFVPVIANEIRADVLEIQNINNIRGMLDDFGSKITPVYALDQRIMYDPDTTEQQARAYAREIVDRYGAHTCDGAGVIVRSHGCYEKSYYAFTEELFYYSLDKYSHIQ